MAEYTQKKVRGSMQVIRPAWAAMVEKAINQLLRRKTMTQFIATLRT